MRLDELIDGAAGAVEVAGLAYDSRSVGPGDLFFCVPGLVADGHDHAQSAVAAGAVALVVERPLGLGVPEVEVASVRAAMPPIAARFHGDPTATLQVAGITGTNGKTTIAYVARSLLEAAGRRCSLLGTVKAVIGGTERDAARTTPEAVDLQAAFREMLDAGDLACAMEVSSHALAMHRSDAIHFAAAVFTNLSRDHLDFHTTMDEYFEAKRRLFTELAPEYAIINLDDEWGRRLAAEVPDAVTYAIDAPADYRARELRLHSRGGELQLETPEGPLELRTALPGRFNVSNVLAATATVHRLGVPLATIAAAMPEIAGAPGRFQAVDEGQPFTLLVDYAHTPDSLQNVLRAARSLGDGRLICVFGCGGDRDRGKRPQMGRIACELADVVIVTSDNPRSEEPQAIVEEILAGCSGPAAVESPIDRREAIQRALELAAPGDVVLIAGKGHEQGQEFADGLKLPFDDVEVARGALRAAMRA